MIKTYFPLAILSTLILSIAFYIKPFTIFIIQNYASIVLEKNIIVTDLDFTNSNISAYIDKSKNKVQVKVVHILPLELEINFNGNIDSFSKYHPLKGIANIKAHLFYDKSLKIRSTSFLYSANIDTTIQELDGTYKIDINIDKFDLSKYQKQNFKDYNITAIVNAKIILTGNMSDVQVNVHSKNLIISNEKVDDIDLKFKLKDKKFTLTSSLKLPYLDETIISSRGLISKQISAQANIQFKDKNININSIEFKDKILSLSSSIFDGKVSLSLKNNKLIYEVGHIDIKKMAIFLNHNIPAIGYVNSNGFIDIDSQDSRFFLTSKLITTNDIKVKNISLKANSYKKLLNFTLDSNVKNKNLILNGTVDYNDDLKLELFTHNFKSDTSFSYTNKHFELKSKHLNLISLQKALSLDTYASSDLNLEAYGTFEDLNFNINTKKMKILKYPKYFKNSASLSISGTFKDNIVKIKPIIKNTNFELSNGMSIYSLKDKKLNLSHHLTLFNKQDEINIDIKVNTIITSPFISSAKITHGKDIFDIDSFSYTKNNLKTNFTLDIKDVGIYENITKKDIHGPVKIDAKYDKKLIVHTPSFGGDMILELDEDILFVKLKSLKLVKIDNFFNLDSLFDKGYLDGNIHYHKATKSADTYLVASNMVLNGIDIDAKLSNLEDTIGLNIVSISSNMLNSFKYSKQETKIKQMQINLSLNNKIIQLDDVALATKKFRIVALGKIRDDGNITKLDVSILDKNGCALLTQGLSGNIKSAEVTNTSGAILDIVSNVPSAILNTGKKVINFGTTSVDSIASFILNSSQVSDKKISLTTDITKKGASIITNTSDIVLSKECKKIYFGIVKHPIQND